eukprot:2720773-Lingulodinium_polyedra.AAC.1
MRACYRGVAFAARPCANLPLYLSLLRTAEVGMATTNCWPQPEARPSGKDCCPTAAPLLPLRLARNP